MIGETRRLRIELLTELLGTVPKDKTVYATYIAGKAKDLSPEKLEEELESVEEVENKGWTGFHVAKNGELFLYEYMIKGFAKTAWEVCQENGLVKKVPAYKKWIDRMLFVEPRKIMLRVSEPDGMLERPLRTMTAKGERVTVSRSDFIKAGRILEFEVTVLKNSKGLDWKNLAKVFEYGRWVGLGQWRGSGGYGRFKVLEMSVGVKA